VTTSVAALAEPVPPSATSLPAAVRRRIFLYLGGLIVLLSFNNPIGGLMDVPISFFLKNRLHLSAPEVAIFRLVSGIPLYLSFLFGLVRDTWHPFGMRDRGLMAVFSILGAIVFVIYAFLPVTYGTLLAVVLLTTTASLFVASAQNGMTSALGQQHAMSGQVSAVWNIFASLPGIAALLVGGSLSEYLEGWPFESAAWILYLAGAALTASVALYCVMRPAAVFDNLHETRSLGLRPIADLRRLAAHPPVYPALAIWLLWNFAPGSTTPLQYYLQNTLYAGDAQWGVWNAIFAASFIPTFLIFAVLCQKFPLRTLLFWGTIVAIPQFVPLLFVHSAQGALIAAAPIGLMGGVATAAYLDLIIRACPPGLEGTTLMMSGGLYFVSSRFGDVLGTHLYERYGSFTICVVMITAVYALILPVLRLIPPELVASSDAPTPPPSLSC
jgi:MFS family permease